MAINPLMLPQIIGMAGAAQPMRQPMAPQPMTPQPMTPQMPQPQQGPDSLAELTRLLGGDLSGSLSSGDKLLALSGLLRSATRSGRRAGLTPEQVISGLQQRKVAEVQNRMALEQMRAAQAQRQQQQQFLTKYSDSLPEDKRGLLQNLSTDEAMKLVSQEITRPKQVFQTKRDTKSGNMVLIFGDGTQQVTDLPLPRNTEDRDVGGAIQVVDKDTGEVLQTIPKTMNAYQAGMLRLSERRESRVASTPRGGGGGGGGSSKQPVQITVDGQTTFGVPLGGFRYQLQDGRTVTATPAKSSSSSFVPQLPPAGAGPRFR